MTILAPTLGIMRPYRARGGELHDVGNGRRLTARQIAMEARLEPSLVYSRLKRGVTGDELLRPKRLKFFDVGNGEKLTVSQIMQRTGLSEASVRSRISRGYTGKRLLQKGRKDMAAPRSSTMILAVRLADAFPDRLPTTKEIRKLYPMCAQTAERWLAAMRAAREHEGRA